MLENNPIVVILAFVIVLTPLILIHELGHFFAAKSVGITILEFGLGFPPKVRKLFTWRETEFTLNWIPLGGFVRPLGEDVIRPLDDESVEEDRQEFIRRQQIEADANHQIAKPKSVNEASPIARIIFMAAGAAANFILAFILFAFVALLGIQQIVGASVQVVNLDSSSVLAQSGLRQDDIITDINGNKFQNTGEFLSTYYSATEQPIHLNVLRGANNEQVTLTVANSTNLAPSAAQTFTQIRDVSKDSPAERADLRPNDLVVAFNGETISSIDDFRAKIQANLGKTVVLTIDRDGQTIDVTLTPRANPPQGQGALGVVIAGVQKDATLGITFVGLPQIDYVPQSLGNSIKYGYDSVVDVISSVVELPSRLMSGAITPQEARPVSVLGISQIGAVFIEQSIAQKRITPILLFIATISVGLGFFNLLPIPALDGGRILFVVIEIIRGKPIAPEREGLVHLIGLALLLSLSVLVLLNDVINPVTNVLR
ncbi:MAG: RIP metalloprotease RseP [Anaerolineaceae bacterium]|nr:RIP metalloprotease RseP [Anaerolineaceae bacterium]